MSLLCELISTNGHQVLCVSNPQYITRELVMSFRGYARRLCFTPVFSLIGAVAKIPGYQKAHARVCSGVPEADGVRLDVIIEAGERLRGIAALWNIASPEERREMVALLVEPGGFYYNLELKMIAAIKLRPAFFLCCG